MKTVTSHRRVLAMTLAALGLVAALAPTRALGLDWLGWLTAAPEPEPESVPVYRLFNSWSHEHLFTTKAEEYRQLAFKGWSQEGVAWYAPAAETSDKPVYRLLNNYTLDHLYTMDFNEYRTLGENGWTQEGELFRSGEADTGIPVYRLSNPYVSEDEAGAHLFTTDAGEYRDLGDAGWVQEGIAFYAEEEGRFGEEPVISDPQDLEIALYAQRFVGTPYVLGGEDPKTGLDCSGLVKLVYEHFGVTLPHHSNSQIAWLRERGLLKTDINELRPGAIIGPSYGGHVGIYYGKIGGVHYNVEAVGVGVGVQLRPISYLNSLVGGNVF